MNLLLGACNGTQPRGRNPHRARCSQAPHHSSAHDGKHGSGEYSARFGVVVGVATLKGLVRLSPVDIPYWVDLRMDWRVLAFCAAVTVGSVLLFGIAPALKVRQSHQAPP